MKQRGLLLPATVLALLAVWVLWRGSDDAVDVEPKVVDANRGQLSSVRSEDLAGADEARRRVPAEARGVLPAIVVSASDVQLCGQAVDVEGVPLESLRVVLSSLRGPWAGSLHVGTLDEDGQKREGFETRTDQAGNFSFAVPVPTSDWISLTVEPDEFHAPCSRGFGIGGPPLGAGRHDLGRLVLDSTGSIAGHLRRADGRPVEGAWISCRGVGTRSDSQGRYLLGGVREDSVRVGVIAETFLSTERERVTVVAGRRTSEVDFVLEESPTISGVVLDDLAEPIAGASVKAMSTVVLNGLVPASSTTTSEDGTFSLFLKDREAQWLEFTAPGFEPHDLFEGKPFPPGTEGLQIVLARGRPTTIRVVDAESGEPVESYGIELEVQRKNHSTSRVPQDLSIDAHPQGVCTLVRTQGRATAHLEAKGYAPVSVELLQDQNDVLVRLQRGDSIIGRVLQDGTPVPSVGIGLTRAEIPRLCPEGTDPNHTVQVVAYDLSEFEGRFRHVRTDVDGRFEFASLAPGDYRLTIRDNLHAPLERKPLVVGGVGTVDVGDLVLEAGATVRGRILGATERRGRTWFVKVPQIAVLGTVQADDRYELTGLPAGHHALFVEGPGIDSTDPIAEVELAPGQTKEVDLDASAHRAALVSVRLRWRGIPLAGYRVSCSSADPKKAGVQFGPSTDADGRIVQSVRPCDAVSWTVTGPSGIAMPASSDVSAIRPGSSLNVELEVEAGELALRFPDEFRIPDDGEASVSLRFGSVGNRRSHSTRLIPTPHQGDDAVVWNEGEVELGLVPPGEYSIYVTVRAPKPSPGSEAQSERELLWAMRGRVQVEVGMRATCALEGRLQKRRREK